MGKGNGSQFLVIGTVIISIILVIVFMIWATMAFVTPDDIELRVVKKERIKQSTFSVVFLCSEYDEIYTHEYHEKVAINIGIDDRYKGTRKQQGDRLKYSLNKGEIQTKERIKDFEPIEYRIIQAKILELKRKTQQRKIGKIWTTDTTYHIEIKVPDGKQSERIGHSEYVGLTEGSLIDIVQITYRNPKTQSEMFKYTVDIEEYTELLTE